MSCVIEFCGNLPRSRLNCLSAAIGGFLFFVGWWLMIDVHACYGDVISQNAVYYLPGLSATVSLIVVNIIPTGIIEDSYYYSGGKCCAPLMVKAFLFVGLLIAFGALIGSSYILVNDFLLRPQTLKWPGFGVFLQNACIFAANMVLKFGTKNDVL